jgi:O-antigen ligase
MRPEDSHVAGKGPKTRHFRLAWPPRTLAWVALAFLVLPAAAGTRAVATYYLYVVLALAALLLPVPAGRPRWGFDRGVLWPLLALFLWALIGILWSTAESPFRDWLVALGLVLVTLANLGAATGAEDSERHRVARALTMGFLIGFGLVAFELFSDGVLDRWVAGDALNQPLARISRSLILLGFAALALACRFQGPIRLLPSATVLLLSAHFDHWGVALGLLAALIVWGLADRYPETVRRGWTILLIATVLLAPLLVLLASLLPADWIPRELQLREQIWRFALERSLEKPLFGWGFDASSNMPNLGEVSLRGEGRSIIPKHPHNAALQLWLELGVPGLLLGGWLLFRLKERVQTPLAQAVLLFTLVNAMVSYGLWGSRWCATIGFGVLMFRLLSSEPPSGRSNR